MNPPPQNPTIMYMRVEEIKPGYLMVTFKETIDPHFDRGEWLEVKNQHSGERGLIGPRTFTRFVSELNPQSVFLVIHDSLKSKPE